ncbi:hypothetical protein WMY93_007551 [Mugilogobius chulae]|uniref:Uncharacterized protein n=1 Tax=Mugilogobius chulae TaxID=88201 RepID=A0AAW0PDD3_9GOBI
MALKVHKSKATMDLIHEEHSPSMESVEKLLHLQTSIHLPEFFFNISVFKCHPPERRLKHQLFSFYLCPTRQFVPGHRSAPTAASTALPPCIKKFTTTQDVSQSSSSSLHHLFPN